MIELHGFQQQASSTIADRYVQYLANPAVTGTKNDLRDVPFYQALSSITASGKTVILADVVAAVCAANPVPPIVLWMSKGKVVVEQTLVNLSPGGKYHHLLGDADVRPLAEYDPLDVADVPKPMVFFATVGTFNQRDREKGKLVIYRSDLDNTPQSTWDALKVRTTNSGSRRPLIVVYDEAQNFSDQQTELLMELEPNAFFLASATLLRRDRLTSDVIEPLKSSGWTDETLITTVDANAVADSGLVKSSLLLAGYQSPMEETLDVLIGDMRQADVEGDAYGLEGRPKAIYVCNTNIVASDAGQQDDPKQPFSSRQAPPIVIWRYLVDKHGVDPDDIAVYCNLKMHKDYPAPPGFHLFGQGDKDYDKFTAGDFHHVIFNLSLQEGWDDPLCYFAYIDKSMESRVAVEQIIGRVLRQPDGRHYAAESLNTAHFYVRVDRNQVFQDLISAVEKQLSNDAPALRVIVSAPGTTRPVEYPPKKDVTIPGVALDATDAVEPVSHLIRSLSDYRTGTENTSGEGRRTLVQRRVGDPSESDIQWETYEQSSKVLARWVFQREIRKRHPLALGVAPTSDPKFDALVGFGSPAEAHIVKIANDVVDAYLDNVELRQMRVDPYRVGPEIVRPDNVTKFKHALHDGYDRLNSLEERFAKALDKQKVLWAKNTPRTGYGIPLPSLGPTRFFYPDFIVWVDDDTVVAIDTKGGHLLNEAASRKLLHVTAPRRPARKLLVRLVSEGQYRYTTEPELLTNDGYTIWSTKAGGQRVAKKYDDLDSLIPAALATK